MKYHFYERANWFLNHKVNKTFEEVLWMNDEDFSSWIKEMREAIVHSWDVLGNPPTTGLDEIDIISQFKKLKKLNVQEILTLDEHDNQMNCLRNNYNYGNAANQWFPTMMKTRINYSKDETKGRSIYDHFADDSLFEKAKKYSFRHFKRDSFYYFSPVVRKDDKNSLIRAKTAEEWIQKFEKSFRGIKNYDYWLEPMDDGGEYTGYSQEVAIIHPLLMDKETLEKLDNIIPEKCKVNVNYKDSPNYRIRFFEKGQKIFPFGFKPFRVSWCQSAPNFPSTIAKFLYEKYTVETIKENRTFNIWDPSSGWGGRILAAMSVQPRIENDSDGYSVPVTKINYVGCDPNLDHSLPDGTTKYSNLADFYNNKVNVGDLFIENDSQKNSYEIFQCGSETIQFEKEFQKYKGNIDFVFTSPPYFIKEVYSEDENQSAKKFSSYDRWRDEFLYETLKTAHEWLRPGGYIAWNIADANFGSELLPLEDDSKKIMESLGFEYQETFKLVLSHMPGSNRIDKESGLPLFKNFCKIGGKFFKTEPIFIYRKKSV